jgi:hypothetical protein
MFISTEPLNGPNSPNYILNLSENISDTIYLKQGIFFISEYPNPFRNIWKSLLAFLSVHMSVPALTIPLHRVGEGIVFVSCQFLAVEVC